MDEIFRDVFGDKLLAVPLGDYPLEPGVPLPSPELLKRKIVIKDKVSAPKGGSSNANTGTLQRTGTIPEVVEEIEPPKEENQTQTKEEADNIAPLPSANKNNQSSLRPMVKRPSLFKGMTILEDTDDGIQSDSPSMRKTPSLEKGNSDDKPSSEEKQPVEEKSNPPVQKKISMEKKESVDESSAPVNSPTKKENESGEPEKKKYERGEALGASSYTEMLNYITAISFVSFEHAESNNIIIFDVAGIIDYTL
jgi:phosphatidylinositol phospholipase C beta